MEGYIRNYKHHNSTACVSIKIDTVLVTNETYPFVIFPTFFVDVVCGILWRFPVITVWLVADGSNRLRM